MIKQKIFLSATLCLLLCGCSIGPKYVKPKMQIPTAYKEAPKDWKYAQPSDAVYKGAWWITFNDPQLNVLIERLNVSNQNIVQLVAQYRQSLAIIDQTKSAYWPTLSLNLQDLRGKSSDTDRDNPGFNPISTKPYSDYFTELNGSWSPDIFGAVRMAVEASRAGAQATAAQLANTQLSLQATLAQTYFQLRMLDVLQKMFDDTVVAYQRSLELTMNQYNAGFVSKLDAVQAESQLYTARTNALDNGVLRAQYEHAIAVLVGEFPENFSLAAHTDIPEVPELALEFPSTLLERRPDIAQAERLMAQANAQVGVQIAAYFPVITLTGMYGFDTAKFSKLWTRPSNTWSIAGTLLETLFDGGLRKANVAAARANYESTVAGYKQTVLTAMQNVEDNLVALRILDKEVVVQKAAVESAVLALNMTMNQYKAGTVAYTSVVVAQVTAYTAKQTAATITSRRLVAAVGLVQALGGGWDNVHKETKVCS